MRILLDVTRTLESGLHTGIQRVVRGLWEGSRAAGLTVVAVRCTAAGFEPVGDLPPHPLQGDGNRELATAATEHRAPADPVDLTGLGSLTSDWLLMADASWYLEPPPWPAVDALRAAGVKLAGLVHDVLPLQQPQWFRPGLQARFSAHLAALTRRAELLLVPSPQVAAALGKVVATTGATAAAAAESGQHPHLACLPLASGLQTLPQVALPAALSAGGIGAGEYFLVVASLEPRKNHPLLLDVFEQRWARGETAALVLVGHAGWCMEDFVARLEAHPERGRRLHWLRDINDAQLARLYRDARATLCLSQAEGFGLPLLEARQLGCPVLANDVPVLRSSGGDWAQYVSLSGAAATVRARVDRALDAVQPGTPMALRDWKALGAELGQVLEHHGTAGRAARPAPFTI